MKVENATLCDRCKKTVAKFTCFICGGDLCDSHFCTSVLHFYISGLINIQADKDLSKLDDKERNVLPVCTNCYSTIKVRDSDTKYITKDRNGNEVKNDAARNLMVEIIKRLKEHTVARMV